MWLISHHKPLHCQTFFILYAFWECRGGKHLSVKLPSSPQLHPASRKYMVYCRHLCSLWLSLSFFCTWSNFYSLFSVFHFWSMQGNDAHFRGAGRLLNNSHYTLFIVKSFQVPYILMLVFPTEESCCVVRTPGLNHRIWVLPNKTWSQCLSTWFIWVVQWRLALL